MAIVTIPDQNRTLQDREAITGYLADKQGIAAAGLTRARACAAQR